MINKENKYNNKYDKFKKDNKFNKNNKFNKFKKNNKFKKDNKYNKFNKNKRLNKFNKNRKFKRFNRSNNFSKFNKLIAKYNRLKKFDKSNLLKKLKKFDKLKEKDNKFNKWNKLNIKEIWKIKIQKKLRRLKRKLRKVKKKRFIKLFKMIPSGRINIRDNVVGHYFPTPVSRLIKDQLIHAGFHLGGSIKRFRPEMSFNLLGKRHSIFLIELTGSVFYLKRGLAYIGRAALLKIPVLFVVSSKEGRDYLSDSIIKRGNYAIKGRYIPGAISNYKSVGAMPELPGVVCIGDSKNCTHSIRECINLDLPFFGICDSEMDPSWFYFPVFGNNDSLEGSRVLCYLVRETIIIQEKNLRKKFGGIARKWRRVLKGVA